MIVETERAEDPLPRVILEREGLRIRFVIDRTRAVLDGVPLSEAVSRVEDRGMRLKGMS